MNEQMMNVINEFVLPEGNVDAVPFGNGHINDTLRVTIHAEQGEKQFVLQRIN